MNRLRQVIEKDYRVEGALRTEVAMNIKRLDGHRLVSRHSSSPRAAGSRTAHAHQRAHEEGSAPRDRRQEEGDQVNGTGKKSEARRRGGGRRPRQRDVQQHDRSRSPTRTATRSSWGSSGKAGFKGSKKSTPFAATVAAEQAAREALTLGVQARARARAGSGQRARVRDPGARRRRPAGQVDQGRHADSAQRLPSAEAPESLSRCRYTGPSCRQCRREGTKLFLKGTKCFTEKCPVERRPYAPGQHGQSTARRRKASEYAKQLREKQKIKRIYGVSEQQFRNTFERVDDAAGHHRAQSAGGAREPARQHRVPHGLRVEPQGRAPAHSPPPRRGESEGRRHAELSRAAGRGSPRPPEVARAGVGPGRDGPVVARRAALLDRRRSRARSAAACWSGPRAETFRSRRRNSWSSSCTRSSTDCEDRARLRTARAARIELGRDPNSRTSLPRVRGGAVAPRSPE